MAPWFNSSGSTKNTRASTYVSRVAEISASRTIILLRISCSPYQNKLYEYHREQSVDEVDGQEDSQKNQVRTERRAVQQIRGCRHRRHQGWQQQRINDDGQHHLPHAEIHGDGAEHGADNYHRPGAQRDYQEHGPK